MNARIRPWLAAALAALLAVGCGKIGAITQPASRSGSADFSVYVSVGTSITAGWESGGLVETHQRQSYAYLFARQAGAASFTIPSVSADGLPPLLRIASLSPLIITNAGRVAGAFTNLLQPTPYHNMAVPYAVLFDFADSTYYYGGLPRPTFQFDGIVRHRGTILQQVVSLSPTFVSVEYGSNEILGAASQGSGTPAFNAAQFGAILNGTLTGLQALAPGVKLALVTVPDVTTIPFFTTFPPYTVSLSTGLPVPLVGPGGTPLAPEDHVLLSAVASLAAGDGFPVGSYNYVNPAAPGTGNPLTDAQVLSAAETVSIQTYVDGYNGAIRTEATNRGAALVDLNGLLKLGATQGLYFQGTAYTPRFVTGGLFSLDGVHPTDLAHGFIANLMIDAVNAQFGASIPKVDLSGSATATASRLAPLRGTRELYPIIENAGLLCPIPRGEPVASR